MSEGATRAASVYNAVVARSRRPLADVADALSVSQSTATRWVNQAREQGLLTRDTYVGEKLMAIATELDVDPAALHKAVSRHLDKNGRLVIQITRTDVADDNFAERLQAARLRLGWSAQRLSAETSGAVSRSVIANIESGRKEAVSLDDAVALAAALGVTVAELDPRVGSTEEEDDE